jgi:hypothetical protein
MLRARSGAGLRQTPFNKRWRVTVLGKVLRIKKIMIINWIQKMEYKEMTLDVSREEKESKRRRKGSAKKKNK